MGGIFGVVSQGDVVKDLYFGVDYHSHLGTKSGGMAVLTDKGFDRSIHRLENAQFRIKFENALNRMHGKIGIGCISDTDPQPLIIYSRLGRFAITTVGRINNLEELTKEVLQLPGSQLLEMKGDEVSPTEVVATLINQKASISEGIRYAQTRIDGSMSILVANEKGIYCGRDLVGRTPIIIGQKADGSLCASFESHAYMNLGYHTIRELGPGEVVRLNTDGTIKEAIAPYHKKRVCSFLWTYYGYPTATYEGVNVEESRYQCGALLAKADKEDDIQLDCVGGIPDSGLAAAIGYANESGVPFKRPFIKYTPTWPRSFMPSHQSDRNLIAHMKLIPVHELIKDQSLLFIDDSIVRGTQLRETVDFLYQSGAKEVHVRPACPPIMYGCKYINFSRSTSDMDLIARRVIVRLEGGVPSEEKLAEYADASTEAHAAMVEEIRKEMHFTSLKYPSLEMLVESIGIPECELCTYCWNGRE